MEGWEALRVWEQESSQLLLWGFLVPEYLFEVVAEPGLALDDLEERDIRTIAPLPPSWLNADRRAPRAHHDLVVAAVPANLLELLGLLKQLSCLFPHLIGEGNELSELEANKDGAEEDV